MKKLISTLFVLVFLLSANSCSVTQKAKDSKMKIATYNLRYLNNKDYESGNGWKDRYPYVGKLIKDYGFEIFGTQEGVYSQLEDLKSVLPGFKYTGVGREDGDRKGEFAAIFYNTDKFELLDEGHFWLSDTTDVPNIAWDAALPRVCSWGKFKNKENDKTFYFFDLHTDHKGSTARLESAKLMTKKIPEIAKDAPAILTGDFNADQRSEPYNILNNSGIVKDSRTMTDNINETKNFTFNGFDLNKESDKRIDYLFLTSDFKVDSYTQITDTYVNSNGEKKYPSDHFPILLLVELK